MSPEPHDEIRVVRCPVCSHELSMFSEPVPDGTERRAARVVDVVASSWFPMLLVGAIAGWVIWNVAARPFEPYPLVMLAWLAAGLSTIAALQGPLILLTQRRSALRDRARDRETYLVVSRIEADLHAIAHDSSPSAAPTDAPAHVPTGDGTDAS